eukprot:328734-Hanusia_phi.AAC.5
MPQPRPRASPAYEYLKSTMTGSTLEGQQATRSDFQTILSNLETERNRFMSQAQSPATSTRIGSSFDSGSRRLAYGQQTPGVLRADAGDVTWGTSFSSRQRGDGNTSDVLSELERVRSGIHASLAAASGGTGETSDDLSSLWKKYQMKF